MGREEAVGRAQDLLPVQQGVPATPFSNYPSSTFYLPDTGLGHVT